MQYKTGKVLVINASEIVHGNAATNWESIEVGDLFSVVGDKVAYEIAAINQVAAPALYDGAEKTAGTIVKGSNGLYYVALTTVAADTPPPEVNFWMEVSLWQLTLSAPYAGATAGNTNYAICSDFSDNFSFPLINQGDIQTGVLYNRTIAKLDQLLVPLGAQAGVNVAHVHDDFIDGGELDWQLEHASGVKTVLDGEQEHPGIISLSTTNWAQLLLGANSKYPFKGVCQKNFELTFIFKCVTEVATFSYSLLGLRAPHNDTIVTDCAGLYILSSGFNAATYKAGGDLTVVKIADFNTNWNRFRMRSIPGSSRIGFSLNGGSETVITSNIPAATALLMPAALIKAAAAQNPEIRLDFFSLSVTNLVR